MPRQTWIALSVAVGASSVLYALTLITHSPVPLQLVTPVGMVAGGVAIYPFIKPRILSKRESINPPAHSIDEVSEDDSGESSPR